MASKYRAFEEPNRHLFRNISFSVKACVRVHALKGESNGTLGQRKGRTDKIVPDSRHFCISTINNSSI